jgi:hypothetical protein
MYQLWQYIPDRVLKGKKAGVRSSKGLFSEESGDRLTIKY